jgi:hypothetical protein
VKLFVLYQCYHSSPSQCYHVSRFVRSELVLDQYTHPVNRRLKLACNAVVVNPGERDGTDNGRTATNALLVGRCFRSLRVVMTVLPPGRSIWASSHSDIRL